MASIFTHILVPIAAKISLGQQKVPARLMLAGMAASMVPDADVIAFVFDISYADAWGHRGFTHSIAFAVLCGFIAATVANQLDATRKAAFTLIFISMVSHPVLDSLTNGGLGVAYFWPFDDTRYFLPWGPIEVSPIGANFFSARGLTVLKSEFIWVFTPLAVVSLIIRWTRQQKTASQQEGPHQP